MIEPAASRFEIGDELQFPLEILRTLCAEVDGPYAFSCLNQTSGTQIRHHLINNPNQTFTSALSLLVQGTSIT
jgi:hypothetical protein